MEVTRLVQESWLSAGIHMEVVGSIGSHQVGARMLWKVGGAAAPHVLVVGGVRLKVGGHWWP